MPETERTRILTGDVDGHPAVAAWSRINSPRERPSQVRVLKESRKSAVYRLQGVGAEGAVIAKRYEAQAARLETALYRDVFPKVSAPTPRFYGSEEIAGGEFWWIFLEDGGNRTCISRSSRHQELAVRWLAALHTSAHLLDLGSLPDAGPRHYLDYHLREGREQILGNLDNPAFSREHRRFLEEMVADLDLVASRWDEVEQFCSRMPRTLVHGDFVPKNIRIKDRAGASVLLAFDWETAGRSVPAADIALCPDIYAYLQLVRETWPQISIEDLHGLVLYGRVFRVLASICWETYSLASKWAAMEMKTMCYFETELADLIRTLGWAKLRRRSG